MVVILKFNFLPITGVVQGMVTGIRGLCNGLGPALYGFVFYLFHVELNEMTDVEPSDKVLKPNMANPSDEVSMCSSAMLFQTPMIWFLYGDL